MYGMYGRQRTFQGESFMSIRLDDKAAISVLLISYEADYFVEIIEKCEFKV